MSFDPVLTTDTPNAGRVKWNAYLTEVEAAAEPDQLATVYVSKAGANTSDGLTLGAAKLTIAAGITAAAALVAGGQRTAQVHVIDAGTYAENLTISDGVHVLAPTANLIGTAELGDDSSLTLNRHYAAANGQTLVQKSGGGGHGFYRANALDTRGTAGTLTGGLAIRNTSGNSILFAQVGVVYVGQDGEGVSDAAAGFGHIHFWTPDLYLAGANAIGIRARNNSNFIGYIDHILEIGTPAGTTAISLENGGAIVKLTASEIIADTAYAIAAGALHVTCPKLTGTRTGTPACELSNVALIGAWGTLDIGGLTP